MELELGGPVWHASASAPSATAAWAMAVTALTGVGDAMLGEWRERGVKAVHIRRRLTDQERELAGGLTVRDIRNKPEEYDRLRAFFTDAPHLIAALSGVPT